MHSTVFVIFFCTSYIVHYKELWNPEVPSILEPKWPTSDRRIGSQNIYAHQYVHVHYIIWTLTLCNDSCRLKCLFSSRPSDPEKFAAVVKKAEIRILLVGAEKEAEMASAFQVSCLLSLVFSSFTLFSSGFI